MSSNNKGPDFICISPRKSGTTWLYKSLQHHKEIYLPPFKEIDFIIQKDLWMKNYKAGVYHAFNRIKKNKIFNNSKSFNKRFQSKNLKLLVKDLRFMSNLFSEQYYCSLFESKWERKAGDISPSNFDVSISTIEYIKEQYPKAKILITLREPTERLWSNVKMYLANNNIEINAINVENAYRQIFERTKNYPLPGIKSWLDVYDSDQVLISYFEELKNSPKKLLKRICQFLEISDDLENAMQVKKDQQLDDLFLNPNKAKLNLEMPDHLRRKSYLAFQPKVEMLHSVTNSPYTSHWLQTYSQYLNTTKIES